MYNRGRFEQELYFEYDRRLREANHERQILAARGTLRDSAPEWLMWIRDAIHGVMKMKPASINRQLVSPTEPAATGNALPK